MDKEDTFVNYLFVVVWIIGIITILCGIAE